MAWRLSTLSRAEYAAALAAAPPAWGEGADRRHNALFTLAGTTADEVLADLPPAKPDIDTIAAGPGVVFWSAVKERITRSAFKAAGRSGQMLLPRMACGVGLPVYDRTP